ncbi:hypothetical protein TNCV_71521 [Trichonephila clavipes]|nr:hypothetical protein TNCV_71521 [Trichonephila clavipes]
MEMPLRFAVSFRCRFSFSHTSVLSEGCFPVVLLHRFDNATGNHLFFPLMPEKFAFLSRFSFRSQIIHFRLDSLSLFENDPFKLQGRVHYTPLVISHWQAHKSLHTAMRFISTLPNSGAPWSFSSASATKTRPNI